MKTKHAFTLIEILLAIGIIAVLATVVVVSLDPISRFRDARDARRLSDIQSILSAVHQYVIDNQGAFPAGLDTTERQIGTASSGCTIGGQCAVAGDGDCVDVSTSLERYLKDIPFDPSAGELARSHYSISLNPNNIVTVTACDSDDASIAAVSR
ncbi:MAG: type II secretion system protein [Candidatus Moraniibacteriota bacterium]|nr:MAG: type II secretion system protein [Candidatus Moranbacteria bacterium]